MFIERKVNGLLITDIINGYLVKQMYIGYSLTEAKRKFKQYLKTNY